MASPRNNDLAIERYTGETHSRGPSRIDVLENRIVATERSTTALLDRALKIKEDVITNLNYTHGTWQEERNARVSLQEHVKTITDAVRKLGNDIQDLHAQIRSRDGTVEGSQNAVRNLEMAHVAGVTDLKGRVVRCDTNISRLATDLKTCYEQLRSLNSEQTTTNSKLADKFNVQDQKISQLAAKIDKLVGEQTMQLRRVEGDSTHQLSSLEANTRQLIQETRSQVNTYKSMEAGERDKLEARLMALIERSNHDRDSRVDTWQKRAEEAINNLQKRVIKIEEDSSRDKERQQLLVQQLENKIQSSVQSQIRQHKEEMAKLKREVRDGFIALREAIDHMKQVLDGKRKLLEEQLRKEIGQIRKMVVLI